MTLFIAVVAGMFLLGVELVRRDDGWSKYGVPVDQGFPGIILVGVSVLLTIGAWVGYNLK